MTHPSDQKAPDDTVNSDAEAVTPARQDQESFVDWDEIQREREESRRAETTKEMNRNIKELVRHLAPLLIRMQYLLGQSLETKHVYGWLYDKVSENLEKLLQDESFDEVLKPLQPLLHKLPDLINKVNKKVIHSMLHADKNNIPVDVINIVTLALKIIYEENKSEIDESLHIAMKKLFAGIPGIAQGLNLMKGQLQVDKLVNAPARLDKFKSFVNKFKGSKPSRAVEKMPQVLSTHAEDLITPIGNMIKLFKPALVQAFKNNLTTGSNLSAIHAQMEEMLKETHSGPIASVFAKVGKFYLSSNRLKGLIDYMGKSIDDAFIDKILKKFDNPEDLEQAQHLIMNLFGPYVASQTGFNHYTSSHSAEQSQEILKKIFNGFEELLLEQLTDPFLDVLPLKERLAIKGDLALFAKKEHLRGMVTRLCDTLHDNVQTKLLNPPAVAEYQIALRKLNRHLAEKLLSDKPITKEQSDEAKVLFENLIAKSDNLQNYIKEKDKELKAKLQNADKEPALTTQGEKDWIYTASRLKEIYDKFNQVDLNDADYQDLTTLGLFDPNEFKNCEDINEFGKKLKTNVEGKLVVSNELAAASRALVQNQQLGTISSKLNFLKKADHSLDFNLEILQKLHKTLYQHEEKLAKFIRENKIYEENKHTMTDSFRAWFKGISVEQIVEHKKDKLERAKELKQLLKNHRMSGTESMLSRLHSSNDTKAHENIKQISEKIHNIKELLEKQKESGSELDKICDTLDKEIIKPSSV